MRQQPNILVEGLRDGDLTHMIDNKFTVDQYQSKMGNDSDVIVLRFIAKEREPAVDLMEFIEKGYTYVLDSDMSAGEESDGSYSVFVELERDLDAPRHVKNLLLDLSRLCGIDEWKFKWYRDRISHIYSPDVFAEVVPLSAESYKERAHVEDTKDITEFFDRSAFESIVFTENHDITFTKTYSSPVTVHLEMYGQYDSLKSTLTGGLQLDEASNSELLFMDRYFGGYDINKIDGKFLIRKGDMAVIVTR